MKKTEELFHHCLYFTANSLARKITRIADGAFRKTGLSPSHAFLIMLVNDYPGIGPKQLGDHLNLAPSTVTRFVDALIYKGLLTKASQGKNTFIYITDQGKELLDPIAGAWKNLYDSYSNFLGEKQGKDLTAELDAATKKLEI